MNANPSKLNMAAMKKAAKTLGIKLARGKPEAAAEMITKHMKENYPEDNLAQCGFCGYIAEESFDPCPYCGAELGEPKEEPKPEKTKKVKKVKSSKDEKANKVKPAKKKGAEKKEEEIIPPSPEEIAECDERIAKIKSFKRNIAEEAYAIGLEIKEIHDKNLWKAKGHKSFSAFCQAELEYTRVMAYMYMAMANFEKEKAVLLGPAKADMINQAADSKKKTLLKMGLEGKTRKEMRNYLNEGKIAPLPSGDKITIVGRVNDEDLVVNWIGDKSGKETTRDTKGKYASFEIVTGILLTIRETDSGTGLTLSFSKIEQ